MAATISGDVVSSKSDARVLLRVDRHDVLLAARGIRTVEAAATFHRVHRSTLFRLRQEIDPGEASLELAMRMAGDLDTTVEFLFERRSS